MSVPTRLVIQKATGRIVTINARDFNPNMHEDPEELSPLTGSVMSKEIGVAMKALAEQLFAARAEAEAMRADHLKHRGIVARAEAKVERLEKRIAEYEADHARRNAQVKTVTGRTRRRIET